ncbi:Flagellar biosynthesis protein FliL [Candidatus Burkholderia verschuerenii]|uniref:Flagellar protein FliL n=1 Tax=Candidatus Burkholderia verschuerenii TaxID=242163 RepID=A0A0L0MH59_9BURK|nr:flagellar basal body-associated protein FliL [Candidatus Burkholderia verschuerenii]KND61314.1 Flagellar biosynthesis protein FliL [Candidatus Burkholderia verschuerenii]
MATTTANPKDLAPAKGGKMKKMIIIAVGAIVLLGAGAGGAYFLLGKNASHAPAKPAPEPPPVFFPLDSLTVNLQSDDGSMHYLRTGLTLKIKDEKVQALLTEHMPEVRSHILLVLSGKKPDDITSVDGKKKLAEELRSTVNAAASTTEKPVQVQEVLFTEFVVQ